jgi:4-phytase / acid phosphatase
MTVTENGDGMLDISKVKSKVLSKLPFVITILLLTTAARAGTADNPTLRFAVILTRHGVRSPSWTLSELNAYSRDPWPDGGAPGALTPHGSKLMKMFGSYYRLYFADAGLLHSAGCEDAHRVYIRADAEWRTRETGAPWPLG